MREVVKELLLRKPQAQKVLYEKFHAVEASSQHRKSFCQATTLLIPKLDADGIQKGNCHKDRGKPLNYILANLFQHYQR